MVKISACLNLVITVSELQGYLTPPKSRTLVGLRHDGPPSFIIIGVVLIYIKLCMSIDQRVISITLFCRSLYLTIVINFFIIVFVAALRSC